MDNDTQDLAQLRQTVYKNFNKRADTLIDLVDALCSQTRAKSVVELSLEPCFLRHYSAIYHALEEYRPGADDLVQLARPYLPGPEQRRFWLLGVDVTSEPRPYA